MLHKMNYTASYSDIIQLNKMQENISVSCEALTKNLKIKDMYVLVMIIFAYGLNEIKEKQVMKIQSRKSINTRKFEEYLGTDIAANTPHPTPTPNFMQLQGFPGLIKSK